jgi:hypothetical protein
MTAFLSELKAEYLWPGLKNCSILYKLEKIKMRETGRFRVSTMTGWMRQKLAAGGA